MCSWRHAVRAFESVVSAEPVKPCHNAASCRIPVNDLLILPESVQPSRLIQIVDSCTSSALHFPRAKSRLSTRC